MSCYLDFHVNGCGLSLELHWKRRCCRSWRLPVTVRLIFKKNDATTVPQVRLHGSRGGVSWPRWPPARLEVLHLFRWYTHTHFHTHRGFYTQKLLQTNTFTHRDRTREIAIWPQFLAIKLHFARKGSPVPLQIAILPHFVRKGCARTRESAILPQFWAFWRSDFISCERVAPGPEKAQFYRSFGLFGDRTSFRAKGLRPDPAVLGFLAIELRFVRKGCVSRRLVGTAPRLQERNRKEGESKRAREQEGKRECEDVRMWRCEDEKMWRWEDGKMRRCEDLMMWRWRGQERMWRCEDEKMSRCEDEKMWRCEDEKIWRWTDVKMRRWWEDVKMRRCEDEQMWRWEDVKMRRCEDCKMLCKDVNMWKCLIDPHTVRRTLRSEVLGKKSGSLAELLRFWCCQVQKLRKSRRIASFPSLHIDR